MKLEEIQDLIKFVSKSGVSEVQIEQKDFKIVIKSEKEKKSKGGKQDAMQQQYPAQQMQPQQQMPQQQMQPQQQVQQSAAPQAPEKTEQQIQEDKYITIKSPMIGTFYRASSPDKDPFVNVGDSIKKGQTICIIEAMKLFNEIEAEVSGKIVKVLVDDSSPVEYDQPLFLVDPS